MKTEEIKEVVKDKYSKIALKSNESKESSCCGPECCSDESAETSKEIKEIVKQQYSNIALKSHEVDGSSCCGSECCTDDTVYAEKL